MKAKVSISFQNIPKKSQRATAECQPTPKMFILGNKLTPVYPNTNLTPPLSQLDLILNIWHKLL